MEYIIPSTPDNNIPQLPNDVIAIILNMRAKIWMDDRLVHHKVDRTRFLEFLRLQDGIIFGSFVLACLLNSKDYDDIDIIMKKCDRHVFKTNHMLFAPETEGFEKESSHIVFCNSYVKDLPDMFNSSIKTASCKWDFIECPDTMQHFKNTNFDIDAFYFDPKTNQFEPSTGLSLFSFIINPTFTISKMRNVEFELIYDPWGILHSANMEAVKDKAIFYDDDVLSKGEAILDRINKLPTKNPKWLFQKLPVIEDNSWVGRENLGGFGRGKTISKQERFNIEKIKIDNRNKRVAVYTTVLNHYVAKEQVSNYRATKILYRILKMQSRGIMCRNLKSFYTNNVVQKQQE